MPEFGENPLFLATLRPHLNDFSAWVEPSVDRSNRPIVEWTNDVFQEHLPHRIGIEFEPIQIVVPIDSGERLWLVSSINLKTRTVEFSDRELLHQSSSLSTRVQIHLGIELRQGTTEGLPERVLLPGQYNPVCWVRRLPLGRSNSSKGRSSWGKFLQANRDAHLTTRPFLTRAPRVIPSRCASTRYSWRWCGWI